MLTFVLFCYGIIIGSFLNALVWRIYIGKSIAKGRSACPDCGHELAVKDLVPVVSWLWLRGKCRYCRKAISMQYPLVELLTGGLFAISYYSLGPVGLLGWAHFLVWLFILSGLIVLAVYDLRWMILPDKVMLPVILGAGALLLLNLVREFEWSTLTTSLLGALILGGCFYAIAGFSKGRWLGGGDIKLAFFMGLLLGVQKGILAMFLAFNLAAIIGVGLIGLKLKSRKDVIPFGPFLVLGAVVSFLLGNEIIAWYLYGWWVV